MERFEFKLISTALNPPRLLLRYVDDTFVIQQVEHNQQFLQHISSIDCHIQFIMENPKANGALPFLDALVSLGSSNTLNTTVYRKPTHTD